MLAELRRAERLKFGAKSMQQIKNIPSVSSKLKGFRYRDRKIKILIVKDIISDLYSRGFSKEKILTNRYLKSKITDNWRYWKKDFEHLIKYVFTKDEVNHNFGGWIKFDYFLPLFAYDYAEQIINENDLQINKYKLASLLFFISTLGGEEVKKRRRKIRREIKNIRNYLQERDNAPEMTGVNEMLKSRKKDALVVYQSTRFYKVINIDKKTFYDYNGLLNENTDLEIEYRTLSFGEDDIRKRLYFFGANKLSNKIKEKGRKKFKPPSIGAATYETLQDIPADNVLNEAVKEKWEKYERYFIRSEKNQGYLALPQLSPNFPFIRVRRTGGKKRKKLICYMPFEFFDIKVLLYGLYKNIDNINIDFKYLRKSTYGFNKYNEKLLGLFNQTALRLPENSKRKANDFITKFRINKHFKQVKKSFKVVQELTNTGIGIDLQKLEEALKEESLNEYNKKELKKIRKTVLSDVRNNGADIKRLYGYFIPHGGVTHRVISSSYNLQGISKKVRKLGIFTAPEGYTLLSYDVSGQDISVALNYINIIYLSGQQNLNCIDNEGNEIYEVFIQMAWDYFRKENDNIINYINNHVPASITEIILDPTDEIYHKAFDNFIDMLSKYLYERQSSFNKNTPNNYLQNLPKELTRNIIKTFVYATLYGAGQKTSTEKLPKETSAIGRELISKYYIKEIIPKFKFTQEGRNLFIKTFKIDKENELENILEELDNLKKRIKREHKIFCGQHRCKKKSLELIKKFVINILMWSNYYSEIKKNINVRNLIKSFDIRIEFFKDINYFQLLYFFFEEFVKVEFPCLFDVLELFEEYYQVNKLTYPTLLGWQTVVDEQIMGKKNFTSSKNTPIQATGGELMRQWLINLSRVRIKENLNFKIVNAIHDQVVLEAKQSQLEKIKEATEQAIKDAAYEIGLDEDSIKLGAPEEGNKW